MIVKYEIEPLLDAIPAGDEPAVARLLRSKPNLVRKPVPVDCMYEAPVYHWLYAGDTPLHLAAAAHQAEIARLLLATGADVDRPGTKRLATPLHYAADGYITAPEWNEAAQVATLTLLLDAGADPAARDKNGATSLHRATRTRCAAAVALLLDRGADAEAANHAGSTSFHLAVQNTGRGGTGEPAAQEARERVIGAFLAHGASVHMTDGKGKTVLERASGPTSRLLSRMV